MRKAILLILLSMAIMFPMAFAAITVGDVNVTCLPLNPITNTCYKDSVYTIVFNVTDTNFVNTIVDGNLQNWHLAVGVGDGTSCPPLYGGTAVTPSDTNIVKTTVCAAATGGNDGNFAAKRNCTVTINKLTNITNGTKCFDLNIAEYSDNTYVAGTSSSDKNASGSFVVNNSLATSSVQSILGIIPLVLVALAIIILVSAILMIRAGFNAITVLPGLIGLLIALIVIGIFLALIAGT